MRKSRLGEMVSHSWQIRVIGYRTIQKQGLLLPTQKQGKPWPFCLECSVAQQGSILNVRR